MRHRDDGTGQGEVIRVAQQVGDEAAIDLEAIHLHAAQVAEAGIAGTEIVQPHAHPGLAQLGQEHACVDFAADHRGFGQLHMQSFWREPGLLQRRADLMHQVAAAQLARRDIDRDEQRLPRTG